MHRTITENLKLQKNCKNLDASVLTDVSSQIVCFGIQPPIFSRICQLIQEIKETI